MTEELQPAVTINGTSFTPRNDCKYKFDYVTIARKLENPDEWLKLLGLPPDSPLKPTKEEVERNVYRSLVLNDLWFICYFILKIPTANHPFVVNLCREIESGPASMTLDILARGHWKTSILSIAETIQYHLKYPDRCTIVFSYKKGLAEVIMDSIRKAYELPFMFFLFPDVLYDNPESQSPSWSSLNGLVVKRNNTTRKEPTVYASGLVMGMAQGFHSERLIFDDFETEDMAGSPDVLEAVFSKFEMAQFLNTKSGNDVQRVIGTIYSHLGPIIKVKEKQKIDKTPMYHTRIIPATEGGEFDGKPVFVSQEELDKLKTSKHYAMQYLCDPTPKELRKLNSDYLIEIEPELIPKTIIKFMTVDWAGDNKGSREGCSWAILVIGIDPKEEDMGANKNYLLDAAISPMSTSEAVETFTRMYMRNGLIQQVGIEKSSGDAIKHFAVEMLRQKGRHLSEETGSLTDLKPAGRNKDERIYQALQWPLNNGKLYLSKTIPSAYRTQMRTEFDQFPYGKKDGIDAWSYVYDMIKDSNIYQYNKRILKKSNDYQMPSVAGY